MILSRLNRLSFNGISFTNKFVFICAYIIQYLNYAQEIIKLGGLYLLNGDWNIMDSLSEFLMLIFFGTHLAVLGILQSEQSRIASSVAGVGWGGEHAMLSGYQSCIRIKLTCNGFVIFPRFNWRRVLFVLPLAKQPT